MPEQILDVNISILPPAELPGPLSVQYDQSSHGENIVICDRNGEKVAWIKPLNPGTHTTYDTADRDPKDIPTAFLLAASWDLHQALADALQSLRRLPDADGAFRSVCIAQAEKALAKAKVAPAWEEDARKFSSPH